MTDFISPERVREIAEDVDGNYYDMGWSVADVGVKSIELATPEIARAVLEMAAKRLERKAAELQLAKQTDEVLLNRAVRLDDADILRQLAKEFRDGK